MSEVLAEQARERGEELTRRIFKLLDEKRAVVVGNGASAHVEYVEDPDLVLKVLREIYDRSDGRPKQSTEVTGAEGGPIEYALDLTQLSDEELDELRRLTKRAQRGS